MGLGLHGDHLWAPVRPGRRGPRSAPPCMSGGSPGSRSSCPSKGCPPNWLSQNGRCAARLLRMTVNSSSGRAHLQRSPICCADLGRLGSYAPQCCASQPGRHEHRVHEVGDGLQMSFVDWWPSVPAANHPSPGAAPRSQ
eukprot:3446072-Pyramimonas_sp.AAC.1